MAKETCAHCGFDDVADQVFTVYDDDGKWGDVIAGKIQWYQRITPLPIATRCTYRACYDARLTIIAQLLREFPGKVVIG